MISGGIASGGDSHNERRSYLRNIHPHRVMSIGKKRPRQEEVITFSEDDLRNIQTPHDDAIVLSLKIDSHQVKRVLVYTGSSADILYLEAFEQMGYNVKCLKIVKTPLFGFTGSSLHPEGIIQLRVEFGTPPAVSSILVDFLVVRLESAYNAIIGRSTLNALGAIVSTSHLKLKFPTPQGIREECGHQKTARDCYYLSVKGKGCVINQVSRGSSMISQAKERIILQMTSDAENQEKEVHNTEERLADSKKAREDQISEKGSNLQIEPADEIELIDVGEGRSLNIGGAIQGNARSSLITFLKANVGIFAWSTAEMPGISRDVAEHKLFVREGSKPVRQKKRNMGFEACGRSDSSSAGLEACGRSDKPK